MMTITCPCCEQRYQVAEELAGRSVLCLADEGGPTGCAPGWGHRR
jgi:hypothetical protein